MNFKPNRYGSRPRSLHRKLVHSPRKRGRVRKNRRKHMRMHILLFCESRHDHVMPSWGRRRIKIPKIRIKIREMNYPSVIEMVIRIRIGNADAVTIVGKNETAIVIVTDEIRKKILIGNDVVAAAGMIKKGNENIVRWRVALREENGKRRNTTGESARKRNEIEANEIVTATATVTVTATVITQMRKRNMTLRA